MLEKYKAQFIKVGLALIPTISSLYASYQGKDIESILLIIVLFAFILDSVFFPFIDKKDMRFGSSYIASDESEENQVAKLIAMFIASIAYLILLVFGLVT